MWASRGIQHNHIRMNTRRSKIRAIKGIQFNGAGIATEIQENPPTSTETPHPSRSLAKDLVCEAREVTNEIQRLITGWPLIREVSVMTAPK
jgi:hypothetical protein